MVLSLFSVGLSADKFAELEDHGLGDGIDHPDAAFLFERRHDRPEIAEGFQFGCNFSGFA